MFGEKIVSNRAAPPLKAASKYSGLEEKLHLGPGNFDHIVVAQGMRLGIERLAVEDGENSAFDVGDEVAMRPAGDDGDLGARLAESGEGFLQHQFLTGIGAVE